MLIQQEIIIKENKISDAKVFKSNEVSSNPIIQEKQNIEGNFVVF